MLKLIRAAFAAALLLGPVSAHAAGTLPIALAQQRDINGAPVVCQVSFFVAGTVATPQNSYSDFGLTQNPNNVLSCDQTGRVPLFWLADGLVHVRMTDASGVPIFDATMQVLGPSSGGGGGGGTVDPTTIAATGDMKARYDTSVIAGWVRGNGLTVGNAASGATERANADTQNLFVHLYNKDANLVVSGGRTGNALADYNSNKTIATPDWRGRALAFMDDMGNSPAGRLTATYFGTAPTVLGAASVFLESRTLAQINVPNYNLNISGLSTQVFAAISANSRGTQTGTIMVGFVGGGGGGTDTGTYPLSGTLASGGSGTPLSIIPPMMLASIYFKL